MKYQTINAGDHFGRLETLERIKTGEKFQAWQNPTKIIRSLEKYAPPLYRRR